MEHTTTLRTLRRARGSKARQSSAPAGRPHTLRPVWLLGLLLLLLAAGACGGVEGEDEHEGTNGTPDQNATSCNEANEACSPGTCWGEGAQMLPGSNCLSCHSRGSGAGEADQPGSWFTAGGTVFEDADGTMPAAGVTIRITDAAGTVVEMQSNAAGNFFTTTPLVTPLSAEVERGGKVQRMPLDVETGACASCHACNGAAKAKIYAP